LFGVDKGGKEPVIALLVGGVVGGYPANGGEFCENRELVHS